MTRPSQDEGSISAAAALMAIVFAFMLGALLVTHLQLAALNKARETAANAARAGSQEIDANHLIGTEETILNETEAIEAVNNIVNLVDGAAVETITFDGAEITVTVSVAANGRTFTATETAIGIEE